MRVESMHYLTIQVSGRLNNNFLGFIQYQSWSSSEPGMVLGMEKRIHVLHPGIRPTGKSLCSLSLAWTHMGSILKKQTTELFIYYWEYTHTQNILFNVKITYTLVINICRTAKKKPLQNKNQCTKYFCFTVLPNQSNSSLLLCMCQID